MASVAIVKAVQNYLRQQSNQDAQQEKRKTGRGCCSRAYDALAHVLCRHPESLDLFVYERRDMEEVVVAEVAKASPRALPTGAPATEEERQRALLEQQRLNSRIKLDLKGLSKNRCGCFLTLLFPIAVLAWGLLLTAYEVWLRKPTVSFETVALADHPPLSMRVSCLLVDAAGNVNPICAGMHASGLPPGSLAPSSLAPVLGLSLLQPFTAGSDRCTSRLVRVNSSPTDDPAARQSSQYSAFYTVELEPWEGAGRPVGGGRTFSAPTRCNASRRDGGALFSASGAAPPLGMGVFRDLGEVPLCPYRQSTRMGAWTAEAPVGGLGFVLQTPILGQEDLNGTQWDDPACLQEGFQLTLAASDDENHRANGLDRDVPVAFADIASLPMTFALSQFSTWVRSADLTDRLSAVQLSLSLGRTRRKAFVGDLKKQGIVAAVRDSAATQDVVSAEATAVAADLRAMPINHMFWQEHEDCVSMQPCGERYVVPGAVYDEFAGAVAAVRRMGALPPSNASYLPLRAGSAAQVAVFDVATGRSPAELARDMGWDGATPAEARARYDAVAAALPPGLPAAFAAAALALEPDLNASRSEVCTQTYGNRSAWQRLSSGCGFTCSAPLAGRANLTLAMQGAVNDEGDPVVVLYLQRFGAALQCGGFGGGDGGAPAPPTTLDATPASQSMRDPFALRLRGGAAGSQEFVRGPALVTAFVFRTDDTMSQVLENANVASAVAIVSQTFAMTGTIFTLLLVVKLVVDLGCCKRRKAAPPPAVAVGGKAAAPASPSAFSMASPMTPRLASPQRPAQQQPTTPQRQQAQRPASEVRAATLAPYATSRVVLSATRRAAPYHAQLAVAVMPPRTPAQPADE